MLLTGCGPKYEINETRTPIIIGDATVDVVVHATEAPGLTYINLHDNEDTAVEAARAVIGHYGGRIIELQHTGERNVQFGLKDSTYVFDPNRIFSDAGIAATLDTLGVYSDSAHAVVRTFADTLLSFYDLPSTDVVVTVHNNTENNYSALSYVDEGEYAVDARFTTVTDQHDPDDFFFVTDLDLYNQIRQAGFNVVLQDNAFVTDDGSLSVYAAQLGVPYVNVEARHGHHQEQVVMIEFLHELLGVAPPA